MNSQKCTNKESVHQNVNKRFVCLRMIWRCCAGFREVDTGPDKLVVMLPEVWWSRVLHHSAPSLQTDSDVALFAESTGTICLSVAGPARMNRRCYTQHSSTRSCSLEFWLPVWTAEPDIRASVRVIKLLKHCVPERGLYCSITYQTLEIMNININVTLCHSSPCVQVKPQMINTR